MRSLNVLCLLLGIVSAGTILLRRDQTISQNTRDASIGGIIGFPFQTTVVSPGVTYWVSGQGPHELFGNLDNSGSIVFSQTDAFNLLGVVGPLVVTYLSAEGSNQVGVRDGNLINRAGGFISLNDFRATTGSTYNFALNTLDNSGNIQFCGRGDNTGSLYTLTTIGNLNNNAGGVITLAQYFGNVITGNAIFGVAGASGTSLSFNINNNGLIRLINLQLPLLENVLGTGCFSIGTGAVLYLTPFAFTVGSSSGSTALEGQSIYFSATTSGSLRFDATIFLTTPSLAPLVYNFGANRFIEFITITPIQSIGYSGSILTVNFGTGIPFAPILFSFALNVGTGYTQSSFTITTNNLFPAVGYRGTATPRAAPAVCRLSAPNCADPATTVSVTFPSSTSAAPTTTTTDPATTTSPDVTTSPTDVTTSTPDVTTTDLPTTTTPDVTVGPTGVTTTNAGAYPSTTTGPPNTSIFLSTGAGGDLCTCPAPSITVYVTA